MCGFVLTSLSFYTQGNIHKCCMASLRQEAYGRR
uniref:Uncharacterized protein n=1 Tax=Anguilla anguilla TaxID=7936 RepID=A0A0E9RDD7_ANGAN